MTTSSRISESTGDTPRVALVTGGSAGLGRALARSLLRHGWSVVVDGRHPEALATVGEGGPHAARLYPVLGDITDQGHRHDLVRTVRTLGRLDLLVLNASTLGRTPLPPLAQTTAPDLDQVWRTNVAAPLDLARTLLPDLVAAAGVLIGVSSDAAVEHYEGWGLYGASKAALDHLVLTLGAENPHLSAYAIDPGDMRTAMHQAAFPGEDISDRPLPETVAPQVLALVATRPASGRYRAAAFARAVSA